MAKKGRLTSIEDPTLAIIGMGEQEEKVVKPKTPEKKVVQKSTSKKVIPDVTPGEAEDPSIIVPELLKRPKKERQTRRFMVVFPESLFNKFYNASVREDVSLSKYILDVLREYAEKNDL